MNFEQTLKFFSKSNQSALERLANTQRSKNGLPDSEYTKKMKEIYDENLTVEQYEEKHKDDNTHIRE